MEAIAGLLLFVAIGGAVCLILWKSLSHGGPLSKTMARTLLYFVAVVLLSTFIGQGWHKWSAVLYCCLVGSWFGQMSSETSRIERASKGTTMALALAVMGFSLGLPIFPSFWSQGLIGQLH